MSTKYFCDTCEAEMEIDQHPFDIEEGGEGIDILYHETGIEVEIYEKLSGDRWREHQCKVCHVLEHGKESFYWDEMSLAQKIYNKVKQISMRRRS